MKFLGIDYGAKRIGLAISDENGKIAFPKKIILNNSNIFEEIKKFINTENISEIVIGDSTNFSNEPNIISKEINKFVLTLEEKFKMPVHKQKEFLTSVAARTPINSLNKEKLNSRINNKYLKTNKVDASAAALILQRYLDKKNNYVLNATNNMI